MKTVTASAVILGAWLALAGPQPPVGPVDAPSALVHRLTLADARHPEARSTDGPRSEELTEVVQQYCVRCHNARRMTGNLTLEAFDVARASEHADVAERMIVKLRAGMMPPPGARRPSPDTLLALVEQLETVVDAAAAAAPNPGARRFQRLNRPEYERVVRGLLDLEVDASRWLPADTYLGNFDNLSAAQGLSTTLLEAYLRAATDVSRMAVGIENAVSASTKYTNPIEVSQHAWDQLEGAPFGTRGGIVVTHDFPVDGEYVFSAETLFGRGTAFEDLDISIDLEPAGLLQLEHNGGSSLPIQSGPVFVTAGQHSVSAAFVRRMEGPYEDRLKPHGWSFVGGEDAISWANYGITGLPHVAELMITGPISSEGVSDTPSRRKIFTCRPSTAEEERPCAESIVERLTAEAYRRTPMPEDVAGPMRFYDQGAAEGGFEIGVRTALQAILASPSFLFRLERLPDDARAGENYRLADTDLAARLSFFLWGMAPDAELRRLAADARLSDPAVLEAQVERMLADPRSEALATRFASQWLRLQDAEKNAPEPFLHPHFTGQLRDDLVRETQLLFQDLVRRDASFFELLEADYTFLNGRLAEHYGVAGIEGPEFRRVEYPDARRRGILGHGSVLLLTSMSDRTSPVLRGKWVMEVLMGTPPPPPPPNVPAFEETEGAETGRRLTTRERMEVHRRNPTCNACHRFIDPIGLALDNYDVIGRWRTREHGMPLDTRGELYDGTPVTTPGDLTDALLGKPIPLARNFAANLLAYGMGRRVEYFDQPAIREIVADAEQEEYRMKAFVMAVVRSAPFQMARAQTATPQ